MAVKNIPIPLQGQDDHDSFSLEPPFGTLFRNVRSNRRRVQRAPGGVLLAPSPIVAGLTSAVTAGSFSTPLVTGAVVYNHDLGTAPLGYIFIGGNVIGPELPGGGRVSTIQNSTPRFIGISDGTRHGVKAQVSKNASNPTEAYSSGDQTACIRMLSPAGTIVVEGVVTASSSSTFTINWTVVDTQEHPVGYTLVGGSAVSCFVKSWSIPTSTGNVAVTGVGFQPQIVLHLPGTGAGAPVVFGQNSLGFGGMTTANQFACDDHTVQSTVPTGCDRIATTAKCIALLSGAIAVTVETSATFVSMDADGFTVHVDNAPVNGVTVSALCIAGMANAKIGSFSKTTASAPVNQSVTNVGFKPDWVFLTGVATNNNAPAADSIRSFGFGKVNATTVWTDMVANGTACSAAMECLTTAIYAQLNTSKVEKVRGTLYSLDTDGFTINWPTNNAQVDKIIYIALRGGSPDLGIIRNYPEVWVGATTVVEKFLMLTSRSAWIYNPVTSSTGIWASTSENYTAGPIPRFSWVNTQGIAAWSQGVDNIRQYDGTTFSDLVASGQNHAAKALIAFADRIVSIRPFFGGIDHQTQIRWPINGNVNNWNGTGSGSLEIIETSQAPLVTGFVLADRAYLAKERELIELIWTGTDSPVFGTQPRVRGMGVLAPHSVALGEQVAFWLGPDDVYMWDGSTLTAIGDRIYNTIDALIDYTTLDQIQGAVWTPDSLYMLVVPPFMFVYDYRRDIWYQDDTTDFQAIGIFSVGTNFTADIDHSQFPVIGDSAMQTIRLSQSATDYLGGPIDSYFTTKDYTAEELIRGDNKGFVVNLWGQNSLREVRFQAPAGNLVEVGISIDRGTTWETFNTTVNAYGVGVAWFQKAFNQIRFRFRDYGVDSYEIHGSWGTDTEPAGYLYP